ASLKPGAGQFAGGLTFPLAYFQVDPSGTTVRTAAAGPTVSVHACSAKPPAFVARSLTGNPPVAADTPATAPVLGLTDSQPGFVSSDHVIGFVPLAAGMYVYGAFTIAVAGGSEVIMGGTGTGTPTCRFIRAATDGDPASSTRKSICVPGGVTSGLAGAVTVSRPGATPNAS